MLPSLYIGYRNVAIISHYGAHGAMFNLRIRDKNIKHPQGILL
jgi:hypothetical protein